MRSLYDLDIEYQKLADCLEESGGEITPEIEKMMEDNDKDVNEKFKGYVNIIKKIESDLDAIKKEERRLKKLKKTKTNLVERLKDNLHRSMEIREMDKYDGGLFKLSFRKSRSINIDNDAKVPSEFVSIETVTKVDKTELKKYVLKGNEVEGVSIEEKKNLQIR